MYSSFFLHKDIVRLLSIIPENWNVFLKSLFSYSLWTIYDLINVAFLGILIGQLETGTAGELQNVLLWYLGIILICHLLLRVTRERSWPVIGNAYQKVVHKIYLRKYVGLDLQYCEKIGTGKSLSIIEKGITEWGFAISMITRKVSRLFLTLLYLTYGFTLLGFIYAIGFRSILIGGGVMAYFLNQRMLIARRKRVVARNRYTKELVRVIMSKVEMMQMFQEEKEISKLDRPLDEAINANVKMSLPTHWFFFGPRLVIDLGRIGLFGLAIFGLLIDGGGLGTIVAIGGGLIMLDGVLDSMLEFYKNITKNFDIIKRMRSYFDNGKPKISYEAGNEFVYKSGHIVLDNLSFSYNLDSSSADNNESLFSTFSLEIQGKNKTALVGVSGSGKSTLAKLIAGYLRPDKGSIYIDDQNLADTSLQSYYKHIGYLTQEPGVFDGTIRENLEYGIIHDISDDRLFQKAIDDAKCDFIKNFPNGLDTEIGERGIRLSGGQRQRLAIAKIFLKDPEIIILDEPTSALDSFSEEAISQAMRTLFKDRTVIIIAHRLQTVKDADTIIFLDNGEVVERGNHNELVARKGAYAKMLELQTGF